MEMIEVESSNVRAIGYDSQSQILRVRYRDNREYERPNTSIVIFSQLMAAKSKGKFLATLMGTAKRVQYGKEAAEEPEQSGTKAPVPLQTHDDDDCCGKLLEKALNAHPTLVQWPCPKCGEVWRPDTFSGVKHWRMRPAFAIVTKR